MFEFPAFLIPTNLGQPMHSPSALIEHVSLNLAGTFFLDSTLYMEKHLQDCGSLTPCLSTDCGAARRGHGEHSGGDHHRPPGGHPRQRPHDVGHAHPGMEEQRHGHKQVMRSCSVSCCMGFVVYVQGGPSASGKRYVDSKFEVAFSCKFIL